MQALRDLIGHGSPQASVAADVAAASMAGVPQAEAGAERLAPTAGQRAATVAGEAPALAALPPGGGGGEPEAAEELTAPGPGSAGDASARLPPPAAPAAEEPSAAAAGGLGQAAMPPETVAAAATRPGDEDEDRDEQAPGRNGGETPLAPELAPTSPGAAAEDALQLEQPLEGGRAAADDALMADEEEAPRLAAASEEADDTGSGHAEAEPGRPARRRRQIRIQGTS